MQTAVWVVPSWVPDNFESYKSARDLGRLRFGYGPMLVLILLQD